MILFLSWWWLWSIFGESLLEEPNYHASYKTREECVEVAKAMQTQLRPFFYCRPAPMENPPPMVPQRFELEFRERRFPKPIEFGPRPPQSEK